MPSHPRVHSVLRAPPHSGATALCARVPGANLSAALSSLVRDLDGQPPGSQRLVTSAVPFPGADAPTDAFFAPLDLAGYNYGHRAFERDHARKPSRVMVATETFPAASVDNYRAVEAHPYVVGSFLWTAIDYIGESAIGATGHYAADVVAPTGGAAAGATNPLACGDYCAQP